MNIDHLIIGGGLAGTTIAVHLHQRGLPFVLIEATTRLGGKIETKWTQEGCFEFGPNSFTNKSNDIFELLRLLQLEEDLIVPDPRAQHRYILKGGKILALPQKPQDLFTSPVLSLTGQLRFLREIAYVPDKPPEEESVWDFFARHFGPEVANYFADPFVSGIYAGDVHRLSLSAAFPTMSQAEIDSGSLLRYLIGRKKLHKTSPQIYQLKQGLESIFIRAREQLPAHALHFSELPLEIIPDSSGVKVVTDRRTYHAQQLYLTVPAYIAAQLLKKSIPELSVLEQIHYAPVITAHLRVTRSESYPFAGFGMLIPSLENRAILGVLWNSSSFPELFRNQRYHYLTVYAGGMHHPDQVDLSAEQLRSLIHQEVRRLFHLKESPEILHMRRHPQAIPQYELGYGKIIEKTERALAPYPAIRLAGNYLGGISMPDTVAHAAALVI